MATEPKDGDGHLSEFRFDLADIWWGPELVILYNDAYRRTLGQSIRQRWDGRAREIWDEIWDIIGPMLDKVMSTGEATWSDDLLLFLERHGYPEETYSHVLLHADSARRIGRCGRSVHAGNGNDGASDRRAAAAYAARSSAARSADAKSETEAWKICAEVLGQNPYDVPFAVLYRLDEEGHTAKAVGRAGIEEAHAFCCAEVQIEDREAKIARYLREVANSRKPVEAHDVDGESLELPGGAWNVPPREVVFKPLWQSRTGETFGVLVAGVNRRKLLDDNTGHFST